MTSSEIGAPDQAQRRRRGAPAAARHPPPRPAATPPGRSPAGERPISLNGRLVDEREAFVPALDRAVTHGIGLYETLKLSGGVPVFFAEHMDRLQAGLAVLEIAVPWDRVTIARAIVELAAAGGITDGGCRVLVTAGPAWGGPSLLIRNDVRERPGRRCA